MDDNKFLLDRLCFWIGAKSLLQEGILHKSESLKKEFDTCRRYFERSARLDRTDKNTISRLSRLNKLSPLF